MIKTRKSTMALWLSALALTTACGNSESESSNTESESANDQEATVDDVESGGTLNLGYGTNPATLDPHITPHTATRDVSRHVFEQLLAIDEDYEVQPSLAERFEVSDDGLVYTFILRDNVTFHNGEPMLAEDVVASMERWLTQSSQGLANFPDATMVEVDENTVELHLQEATLIGPNILADVAPLPAIMPKEIAEEAGTASISEYIGTGPFQLEEWSIDQHVHLTKFEDYQSPEGEASGLAGEKEALVDEVFFNFITDASTRVNGITTGEYDIAFNLPLDSSDQIDASDGVEPFLSDGGIMAYVFNNDQGPLSDHTLRHAVNTAVNMNDALMSAYSDDRFYSLDPALANPNQSHWYSEAGSENYNQNDIEAAKTLVEQSEYAGEEVVILATSEVDNLYNIAIYTQQALEEIGLNASLSVYDWASFEEARDNPENFDLFVVDFAVRPTLHQYPFLSSESSYPGWTESDEIDEALKNITQASTIEDAQPYVDELQLAVWDYLPISKIGNKQNFVAHRESIENYRDLIGPILWNVTKDE
ncbi:ABC transporter substrate-binding protein [Geomicrobium sediminis]|uniref:Peptide/nickel transport system substrate-binding protein n=1 Tax=Geomicrobium sediminis TaxID=1347788 RepID=A0ABS2PBY9_9BACL|nr:ABC transporter substrate-binding protein [Geomicrobium sediminis]MBM7632834.1 peptide/nickel transport system substrate-binding protein [Geomicrobium sediminis]